VRLIPRDEKFYDMFEEIASRLVSSATLLNKLFADPARIGDYCSQIKDIEHEADRITHDVIQRIDRSFVTPIDREDIHELASKLDNVIDLIDGTARRAVMFRVTDTREHAKRLSQVLVQAAAALQALVAGMKRTRVVTERSAEVKRLEEEGDAIYHEAVGELFAGKMEALDVIKWKEIYDTLERALDECEDVANAVGSIALKNF
jgi:uncharacterized protein Yka (UPF0111/DUF47 family)